MKLNIKIFLLSFYLAVATSVVFSQASPPVNFPQIIPPSPEAASLGKYGDLPVGMFTGHPNVTIPLYTVTTKHLSVPISLNYNVNGIKVNELSTNVGMSWALNCGGVISRTIYGFPDFNTTTHVTSFPPSSPSFNTTNPDGNTIAWMYAATTGQQDTQADAFNFNFGGYAGKFFIIPQGTANAPTYKIVSAPYTNIKIQYDFTGANGWNFLLTTPDGVMYYFGGTGATEQTETTNNCGTAVPDLTPTAWYLTKIQHPYDASDNLTFTYTASNYQYSTGTNQVESYWDGTGTCAPPYNHPPCTCGPTPYIYGTATLTAPPIEQFCTTSSQIFTYYVSSITDGKYNQVLFDYIAKTDANAGYLLSHITVNNNQTGQKIKSFSFTYQTANPLKTTNTPAANNSDASTKLPRPFLTEVDELDNVGAIVEPYKFGYNDFTQLPPRLSFSQDYWGYYNGVNNYASAIPLPQAQAQLLSPTLIANRNPDYNYASMGLLNKVTYPTGGYTSIQYEGNTISSTYAGATDPTNLTTPYSTVQSITVSNASPNQTFMVAGTSPITVTLTATVSCNCPSGTGCADETHSNPVWGTLVSGGTTVVQPFDFTAFNGKQGECSVPTIIPSVTLQPGVVYGLGIVPVDVYQFTLNVQAATNSYLSIPLPSHVAGTQALQYTAGGMRVKRLVSFEPVANNSTIKNYIYDPGYAHFPAQPTYYHHLTHIETLYQYNFNGVCAGSSTAGLALAGYHQFSSSSFIDAFGQNSSPVYYCKVTEELGDNYENGGIEHDFSYNNFLPITQVLNDPVYSASAPSLDWRNGLETSTRYFKMVSGLQVNVQTKTMNYTIDSRNGASVNQYVIEKRGNADPITSPTSYIPPNTFQIQNYNVAQLNYISEWQYLASESRQDYDLNGNPTAAITTNYFYDNPTHALLTRVQSTDSKGLLNAEIKRYPQDNATISSLTATESTALTNLVTQGRIGELIEDEKDKNSALVQRAHNAYNSFTSSLVLPQYVMQQNGVTGGTAYTEYTVNSYDANGNITQLTPKSGVPVSYIWDYMGTIPIAQVQNATQPNIAYTSFEADGHGNWVLAGGTLVTTGGVTGSNSYTIASGNTIGCTGLASGNYTVTYWTKGSSLSVNGSTGTLLAAHNGWNLYSHSLTGVTTATVTGAGTLDELRLYPAAAQMVTYTYTPLVGLTSQCDAANKITYYTYDSFGREQDVKDFDGNIIKSYNYQYQQPK